jgi:hypothetical protein
VLTPWFIYSFNYYGNIFGALIHGAQAANYWGGVQSWSFFIENSWRIFSIQSLVFLLAVVYILSIKEYRKKELYLLILWILFFSVMVMSMPHKEDRYIIPVLPAFCLILGFFVDRLGKYKNLFFGFIFVVSIFSVFSLFRVEHARSKAPDNVCFSEGNKFLASDLITSSSVIVTNQSPIVHYYTNKATHLYPDVWSLQNLKDSIYAQHEGKIVYIFFANYDMSDQKIKSDLENNFKKVFECSKGWGYSSIYLYN